MVDPIVSSATYLDKADVERPASITRNSLDHMKRPVRESRWYFKKISLRRRNISSVRAAERHTVLLSRSTLKGQCGEKNFPTSTWVILSILVLDAINNLT